MTVMATLPGRVVAVAVTLAIAVSVAILAKSLAENFCTRGAHSKPLLTELGAHPGRPFLASGLGVPLASCFATAARWAFQSPSAYHACNAFCKVCSKACSLPLFGSWLKTPANCGGNLLAFPSARTASSHGLSAARRPHCGTFVLFAAREWPQRVPFCLLVRSQTGQRKLFGTNEVSKAAERSICTAWRRPLAGACSKPGNVGVLITMGLPILQSRQHSYTFGP